MDVKPSSRNQATACWVISTRLHPVHRLLGHGIEILHSQRGAVESLVPQRADLPPNQAARIDLHAEFRIGGKHARPAGGSGFPAGRAMGSD